MSDNPASLPHATREVVQTTRCACGAHGIGSQPGGRIYTRSGQVPWAYASEYFIEKWDYWGQRAKLLAVLGKQDPAKGKDAT